MKILLLILGMGVLFVLGVIVTLNRELRKWDWASDPPRLRPWGVRRRRENILIAVCIVAAGLLAAVMMFLLGMFP